ncbi:aminotransferase class V-fold PLP-dependent enzyme, partial [bacterium]|nr:aminotransferase class V-fold PLP-dependent enzyme [bacterium]
MACLEITYVREEWARLFEKCIALFGVSDADCVIFTRGTTEAMNLVASSWGRSQLGPGDEIVLPELEHHANIV